MADPNPLIVEPAPEDAPRGNWAPVVGPEGVDFLQNVVPEASRDSMREAAVSILAKGTPPTAGTGQETGLIVGYVQSGKTMSLRRWPLWLAIIVSTWSSLLRAPPVRCLSSPPVAFAAI